MEVPGSYAAGDLHFGGSNRTFIMYFEIQVSFNMVIAIKFFVINLVSNLQKLKHEITSYYLIAIRSRNHYMIRFHGV